MSWKALFSLKNISIFTAQLSPDKTQLPICILPPSSTSFVLFFSTFKKNSPVVKEDKVSVLVGGHVNLRHNTRVKVAFVESDTAHPNLQHPQGRPTKIEFYHFMLKLQQNIGIFGLLDPNLELILIKNFGKTFANFYSMWS